MIEEEYLYCEEGGCEIRRDEDLGFEGLREERLPGLNREMVEVPFYICRACKEERDQVLEDLQETPQYQYECAFAEWAREQTT